MGKGSARLKLRRHTDAIYSFHSVALVGIANYVATCETTSPCLHIHGDVWVSPEATDPTSIFKRDPDCPEKIQLTDPINDDREIPLTLNGPRYPVRYSFTRRLFINVWEGEETLASGYIDLDEPEINVPTFRDFRGLDAIIRVRFAVISPSVPANLRINIHEKHKFALSEKKLYEKSVRCIHKKGETTVGDFELCKTFSGVDGDEPVVVPVGIDSSLTLDITITSSSGDLYEGTTVFELSEEDSYMKPYSQIICDDKVEVTITCQDNYVIDCCRRSKIEEMDEQPVASSKPHEATHSTTSSSPKLCTACKKARDKQKALSPNTPLDLCIECTRAKNKSTRHQRKSLYKNV